MDVQLPHFVVGRVETLGRDVDHELHREERAVRIDEPVAQCEECDAACRGERHAEPRRVESAPSWRRAVAARVKPARQRRPRREVPTSAVARNRRAGPGILERDDGVRWTTLAATSSAARASTDHGVGADLGRREPLLRLSARVSSHGEGRRSPSQVATHRESQPARRRSPSRRAGSTRCRAAIRRCSPKKHSGTMNSGVAIYAAFNGPRQSRPEQQRRHVKHRHPPRRSE